MLTVQIQAEKAQAREIFEKFLCIFADAPYPIALIEEEEASRSHLWNVQVLFEKEKFSLSLAQEEIEKALEFCGFTDLIPFLAVAALPDQDWVRESLKGLGPVRAGRFIIHGAHDRGVAASCEIGIEIEAAQAFGTGHHATTYACLLFLNRLLFRYSYRKILDLGTGSGILAIASARATRRPVLATDCDPIALSSARLNAYKNKVGHLISFQEAQGFSHRCFTEKGPFDLIIANILARPLAEMAALLTRRTAPRGHILLSGLRERDGSRILATYRLHGTRLLGRCLRDGWLTLLLEKTSLY